MQLLKNPDKCSQISFCLQINSDHVTKSTMLGFGIGGFYVIGLDVVLKSNYRLGEVMG